MVSVFKSNYTICCFFLTFQGHSWTDKIDILLLHLNNNINGPHYVVYKINYNLVQLDTVISILLILDEVLRLPH